MQNKMTDKKLCQSSCYRVHIMQLLQTSEVLCRARTQGRPVREPLTSTTTEKAKVLPQVKEQRTSKSIWLNTYHDVAESSIHCDHSITGRLRKDPRPRRTTLERYINK